MSLGSCNRFFFCSFFFSSFLSSFFFLNLFLTEGLLPFLFCFFKQGAKALQYFTREKQCPTVKCLVFCCWLQINGNYVNSWRDFYSLVEAWHAEKPQWFPVSQHHLLGAHRKDHSETAWHLSDLLPTRLLVFLSYILLFTNPSSLEDVFIYD